MEFWIDRETGRIAGGKVIVAVYADHNYLGALACDAAQAGQVGIRLHMAERLAAVHVPCHDPDDEALMCPTWQHNDALDNIHRGDPTPPVCRECEKPWPCETARIVGTVETPSGPDGRNTARRETRATR